jgi:hypothetical protein
MRQAIMLAFSLILITGCSNPVPPTQVSPLTSPIISPIMQPAAPILETVFTATLTSPTGRINLMLTCTQCCTDIPHCRALLPNGKTIYEADKSTWSPDDRYAMICMNSFHDSPCGWYEVWDMINGEKRGDSFTSYCYQWSPNDDHLLVYLVESSYIGTPRYNLMSLNPKTNELRRLQEYPTWFRPAGYSSPTACIKPLGEMVPTPDKQ